MVQVVAQSPGTRPWSTTSSNQTRAPVWKTVVKVVLIVVAVAAAIYLGAKFVYPAVVKILAGVGNVVTAAGELGAEAAATATTAVNIAKHATKGIHTVLTVVDKVIDVQGTSVAIAKSAQDALTITTTSGTFINPGAMQQFIANPFKGILNIIIGAFTK